VGRIKTYLVQKPWKVPLSVHRPHTSSRVVEGWIEKVVAVAAPLGRWGIGFLETIQTWPDLAGFVARAGRNSESACCLPMFLDLFVDRWMDSNCFCWNFKWFSNCILIYKNNLRTAINLSIKFLVPTDPSWLKNLLNPKIISQYLDLIYASYYFIFHWNWKNVSK